MSTTYIKYTMNNNNYFQVQIEYFVLFIMGRSRWLHTMDKV